MKKPSGGLRIISFISSKTGGTSVQNLEEIQILNRKDR